MIRDFNFGKMPKRNKIFILALLIILSSAVTVYFYHYSMDIDSVINFDSGEFKIDSTLLKKPVVYIGVISRYPPNIIFRGYQPILDYLSSKTNYRFELKLSDDYNQAVKMLIDKEVVTAFLGSYVYIKAHEDHGVIPILKPLNENFEPSSRSVLFTGSSSKIFKINELRGARLALPSKESFSSNWLLKYEFKLYHINENELKEIKVFPHHQSVIHNVSKNFYDAGVTREYLVKKIVDGSIRILMYSDPIPTSPLVVAPGYPKEIIEAIKKSLLEINAGNPQRELITRNWDTEFIYGFVEANDKDYDIIRMIGK